MLERLKDRLFGKPKDEELEKLASYVALPNSLKRKVASAHTRLKGDVLHSFNEAKINKDFTNEELLNEITHVGEFVDKSILKVIEHTLSIDDDEIDAGHNTDVYVTNKRLILLNTTNADYPELSVENPSVEIKRIAEDSLREISIPNKQIKNISIDMRNQVIGKSTMIKKHMLWISVIGAVILLFKFFACLVNMNFEDFGVCAIFAGILIAVGFLLKLYPVADDTKRVVKIKSILLSVIEPFYGRRALLKLDVDSTEHSVIDVVNWVKNLQSKID